MCPENLIHVGHCLCKDVSQLPPFLLIHIFIIKREWKRLTWTQSCHSLQSCWWKQAANGCEANSFGTTGLLVSITYSQRHFFLHISSPFDVLINTHKELKSRLVSSTSTANPFSFVLPEVLLLHQKKSPQDKTKQIIMTLGWQTVTLIDCFVTILTVLIKMCKLSHDVIRE